MWLGLSSGSRLAAQVVHTRFTFLLISIWPASASQPGQVPPVLFLPRPPVCGAWTWPPTVLGHPHRPLVEGDSLGLGVKG